MRKRRRPLPVSGIGDPRIVTNALMRLSAQWEWEANLPWWRRWFFRPVQPSEDGYGLEYDPGEQP